MIPIARLRLKHLTIFAFGLMAVSHCLAVVWQYSVPVDSGKARAFLWIPPDCMRVRAVLVANHNMIEQGILEHPTMRDTLAKLGIAEVWVVPAMDAMFDFNKGAGERFERIMADLSDESGYGELRFAPVVPIAHSACASYPWNFAAWNPGRTLAILSVHGDAPQTTMTGNGKPRINWGNHNIDGVPGLMVMGQYEWSEDRLTPAFDFLAAHPATPMAFLGDAGHGHYDYSDALVSFLAMFVRKAAEWRLPAESPAGQPVELKPVDPKSGWRVDRWRKDKKPTAPAAPYAQYAGDPNQAFWCFDEEMARVTEEYYARDRGKLPQLLSVTAYGDSSHLEKGCGEPVMPPFIPMNDGVSFRLSTAFMKAVPSAPKNTNARRWADLPGDSPLGHATGGGPIKLSRSVGPVIQTGSDTFAIQLGRAEYVPNGRNRDMWIIARHGGDDKYREIVQQVLVHAVPNTSGAPQKISFPPIPDQKSGIDSLKLPATSDAGLDVSYYVREGPAEIEHDRLIFTTIPPRSRFPVEVTVVAWQWGRQTEPGIKTADPVERTFHIVK